MGEDLNPARPGKGTPPGVPFPVGPLPRTRSCFVCGIANPLGFRLQMQAEPDGLAVARFEFRREHVGFQDTVHGGLISTILDEVMVWACGVATRQFTYCAELTVRFRRPVRPEQPVVARARMTENRKGRLFLAEGSLFGPDGEVCCEATGKYIPLPPHLSEQMFSDFAEDPKVIVDR